MTNADLAPYEGGLTLIVLLDRKLHADSRIQLVEWARRCRVRGGLGFITGVSGPAIASLSRGLKDVIYNAGLREVIAPGELLGWMSWKHMVIIDQGHCWEIPLLRPMAQQLPATVRRRRARTPDDAYRQLGTRYQDHTPKQG